MKTNNSSTKNVMFQMLLTMILEDVMKVALISLVLFFLALTFIGCAEADYEENNNGELAFEENSANQELAYPVSAVSVKEKICATNSTVIGSVYYQEGKYDMTGCKVIDGDLILNGAENLSGLKDLQEVKGSLFAVRTKLTNLKGLEKLTKIGRSFLITDNKFLANLSGIEGLISVGDDFIIKNNNGQFVEDEESDDDSTSSDSETGDDDSTSEAGDDSNGNDDLSGIIFFRIKYLRIDLEQKYTAYPVFEKSSDDSEREGEKIIESRSNKSGEFYGLSNIYALKNLKTVGKDLFVGNNDALATLVGLDSVKNIGRNFFIEENDSIKSLAGLGLLSTVGADVMIRNNEKLYSLKDMKSISEISMNLYIQDNPSLPTCEAENYVKQVIGKNKIKETINISGNNNALTCQ